VPLLLLQPNREQSGMTIPISDSRLNPQLLDHLSQLIVNLRYGAIELTVHDGRVVQIERREKWRMNANPQSRPE